jgi:hypothetical protein
MGKIMSIMLIITGILAFLAVGCSRKLSDSLKSDPLQSDIPLINVEDESGSHELLGMYTMQFDPDSMSATVVENRDLSVHLNVKPYIPAPIIQVNSWDPVSQVINVSVTIRNPTNLTAYDVRLIIYTDNMGHTITNPDDWTPLYDIPGGLNINPFRAYNIHGAQHVFEPYSQYTESLGVKLPGGNPYVQFAIDASFPGNCEEPYEIYGFSQEYLYDKLYAMAQVHFYVNTWNPSAIVSAWIECPAIFGTVVMQIPTGDNHYFEGNIVNYEHPPIGVYPGFIKAKTQYSSVYLYDVVNIYITRYSDTGWMVHFDDANMKTVESDNSENCYVIMGEKGSLIQFDDTGDQVWARVIKGEDPYTGFNDLHYDQYLYVAGDNTGSPSGGESYMAGMYGTSNTRYWVDYSCVNLYYMSGACITGNDDGISYVCSSGYYQEGPFTDNILHERIIKHDVEGGGLWARDYDTTGGNIEILDLAIDDYESFYATGVFQGTEVDFDPYNAGGEVDGRTMFGSDGFLAQYDSDGYLDRLAILRGSIPLTGVLEMGSIIPDDSDLLVTGVFNGTVDFDPGPGTYEINAGENSDLFFCRFDSDFNLIKAIYVGEGTGAIFSAFAAMDLDGNFYITGSFIGSVDFDPEFPVHFKSSNGAKDIYLLKLDKDLNFEWVQTWGSVDDDEGTDVACNIYTGAIYMVGQFSNTMDFDPSGRIYEKTPNGDVPDSFLMKILPNGDWYN